MPTTITPPPGDEHRPFEVSRANPDGTVTLYYAGEPVPPLPAGPTGPAVPDAIPRRLARLVLLASGRLGPSVTTLDQLDAAILGAINAMVPAGIQREAARGAYIDSIVWERRNATLIALMTALGMTEADRDGLFQQADAMRQAELAAQGGVA